MDCWRLERPVVQTATTVQTPPLRAQAKQSIVPHALAFAACLRPNPDTPPHPRSAMRPSPPTIHLPLKHEGASRPSSEGAGKAGCPLHPRSVCENWKHTAVTTGGGGSVRPSLRNGFNGFLRALPSDRAFLPLSPAQCRKHCRRLDASVGASGPHDFAVRRLAVRPHAPRVRRRCRVHRIPNPTFVTIAKRPSIGNGMARDKPVIWVKWKEGYF
jgi:hypothetical protein